MNQVLSSVDNDACCPKENTLDNKREDEHEEYRFQN
jgi:hypothetical protein